jgi:hypothetical protein
MKKTLVIALAVIVVSGMFLLPSANATTVAHYRFEQDFTDSGPNDLHGTGVGPLAFTNDVAPFTTTGSSSLDATEDYDFVRVEDDPLLHLTGDFTVEAFVRPFNHLPGGGIEPHWIVGKQNYEGGGNFLDAYDLHYNQDTGRFRTSISFGIESGKRIRSASIFDDNEWHHVAMTYTLIGGGQATLNLFVDGNLEATDTFNTLPLFFGDDPLYIGAGNFATPDGTGTCRRNFIGNIDEVRISDVALSPDQFLNNQVIPEPSTLALFGLGIVAVLGFGYRRFRIKRRISAG